MKTSKFLRFVTGTTLAVLLAVSASAAFNKTLTYADGTFGDVAGSAWYAKEVASAYELGFMNGVADGVFSPDGNVTVAEGITMASRVHAIYNGKTITDTKGANWYDMYVSYAKENKIITDGEFDSFTRPIKRYEMAVMFVDAMPADYYSAKNTVDGIPDVSPSETYYAKLLTLYKAGVVMGSDDYGTFHAENSIKRSETAAIINRVALPENRLTGTLTPMPSVLAPLYFVNDNGQIMAGNYGTYGWDCDNRGMPATSSTQLMSVLDIREDARTAMLRQFNLQTSGKLTLETTFTLSNATNGFHVILSHEDGGKAAMDVFTKDGYWYVRENGKETNTNAAVTKGLLYFKSVTDLDNKTTTLSFDGKKIGTYGIADADVDGVNYLIFTSEVKGTCAVTPNKTNLYNGYTLNETFASVPVNADVPYTWTFDGTGSAKIANHMSSSYDPHGLTITAPAGSSNTLSTSFDPISRKASFEMKFRMDTYQDGTAFAVTNGGNEVIKIYTKDKAFYSTDGTKLYDYDANVWQTLRIEVNTLTGKVVYKVDNRIMGEGKTTVTSFDGIKVTLNPASDAVMFLDDFYVYNMFDDDADYVPVPKPVASPDYEVGMEVCDIWRNGFQFGWDYTSAFDALTPYLGLYDEGSTEAADWQNKWLSEHGVDYMLECWYGGTPSNPLKTPRNSFGLNGYMNSKYSDTVKYALMWENSGNLPKNAEEFRKYLVPYWVEYYFKDKDRYFTIDNKAVVTIYRTSTLATIFGDNDQVKAEMDYLRQEIMKCGYDGVILLTANGSNVKAMGFDGYYSYNLGTNAFTSAYQESALAKQSTAATEAGVVSVPTVAVGFCNIALAQGTTNRTPNISLDEYTKINEWVKTDLLAKRDQNSWSSKMVILSNWNEFGEGHYIMPANLNGFGYLDVIRKAYADSDEHEDVTPSAEERARFNSLYYQAKKRIRRLYDEDTAIDAATDESIASMTSVKKWDMSNSSDAAIWEHSFGTASFAATGSSLKGASAGGDFAFTGAGINVKAEDVHYLHIRIKLSGCNNPAQTLQVYFITSSSTSWDENKATTTTVKADGEFHDYYIDMSSIKAWAGTVSSIRIDPISRGDCEFEVTEIELLQQPQKPTFYINNTDNAIVSEFPCEVTDNGTIVLYANPFKGIFSALSVYYTWDYDAKLLSLYSINHSIKLTMGSSKAMTDKGEIDLGFTPYLKDGIPAIPMIKTMETLGFTVTGEGSQYIVATGEGGQATSDEEKYYFEFDVPGYLEGFTTACVTYMSGDGGAANCVSTSNGKRHDPVFNSPTGLKIPAAKYGKVVVGLKYELEDPSIESINSTFFFRSASGSFNENEMVRTETKGSSSNGKFVEIEFDMTSNKLWTGTIDAFRFDPFEASGSFSVDYIRIILTDPDADVNKLNLPTEIKLDASTEAPQDYAVTGLDANVTIIDDPTKEGNKIYYAKSTAKKKAWTYFKVGMQFQPGATYQIDYDVYFLENSAGVKFDALTMGANLKYNEANHTGAGAKVKTDEWIHCTGSITVDDGYYATPLDFFAVWADPYQELGVSFYVDNVSVKLISGGTGASTPIAANEIESTKQTVTSLNETADGKTALYPSGGKGSVADDPEKEGNKVFKLISPNTRTWNYIQANVEYKAGATYKFSCDVYFLEDGNGKANDNNSACVNFFYGEDGVTASNHAASKFTVKGVTKDGWHHLEGEYTIPATYQKTDKDYFGVYANPVDNIGVSMLVDNVKLEVK